MIIWYTIDRSLTHIGPERMKELICGSDGCLVGAEGLEACAPIPVPLEDPDFAHFNRCLKFVRNLEVPHLDCRPGAREQLNQVSHWLDGSQVYGSTSEERDLLRDYSNSSESTIWFHTLGSHTALFSCCLLSPSPIDILVIGETVVHTFTPLVNVIVEYT